MGSHPRNLIEQARGLVVPYWPADPELGSVDWPATGITVLMPGRWTPPLGPQVAIPRLSYLEQAQWAAGSVDTLVVAARRHGEGWVLPGTAGVTGAVAERGVRRLAVVETPDAVVIPGAPQVRCEEVEVLGQRVAAPGGAGGRRAAERSAAVDAIGAAVASVVAPGSWLELGIGALPSAVLHHVAPRRVAGFLCGMVGDEVLAAAAAWAGTGWRGSVLGAMVQAPPPMVADAVAAGRLRLVPVEASHGAHADLPLVAVNGALEVDLRGNVNAEVAAGRRVSGRGGHPDFSRRAHFSPGGVSVVVLRSRDRAGRSAIVAAVAPDATSTDGGFVDVVVTEQGLADLRGLGPEGRAAALIAVAHPEDRPGLRSVGERVADASSGGAATALRSGPRR